MGIRPSIGKPISEKKWYHATYLRDDTNQAKVFFRALCNQFSGVDFRIVYSDNESYQYAIVHNSIRDRMEIHQFVSGLIVGSSWEKD
jgi:hypothetical protein